MATIREDNAILLRLVRSWNISPCVESGKAYFLLLNLGHCCSNNIIQKLTYRFLACSSLDQYKDANGKTQ